MVWRVVLLLIACEVRYGSGTIHVERMWECGSLRHGSSSASGCGRSASMAAIDSTWLTVGPVVVPGNVVVSDDGTPVVTTCKCTPVVTMCKCTQCVMCCVGRVCER